MKQTYRKHRFAQLYTKTMTLFNATELFTQGNSGTKVFDLPDTELTLIDQFFSKEESDHYYDLLLAGTPWREYEMHIYDKTVTAPRMVAWYQDHADPETATQLPWTKELLAIRKRVEETSGYAFNSVLLNLYRDGNDGVAWHSDHEDKTGRNPVIASVTFGETRMFRLRHKTRKDISQVEIPLYHGSYLLMAGTTNTHWQHQVPKTARKVLPRINLTFRQLEEL
jgi:alkylated DNA repair dioxygenase AlkB